MPRNHYFTQGSITEQLLYEDIVVESLKIYGQDTVYMPRTLVNKDEVLGDDTVSAFNAAYKLEMYIENTEGFDGEGDLFSKFGVEIRDECTFVVSRRSWNRLVKSKYNDVEYYRPREGDLVYLGLSGSIFEIQKVETESPFYQIQNLPVFKLRATLFENNGEDFDTGYDNIDKVEADGAYAVLLTISEGTVGFDIGETITQTLASGQVMTGEITSINDSDGILGLAHVGASDGNFGLFAAGSIVSSKSNLTRTVASTGEQNIVDAGNSIFDTIGDGFIDFSETNPFGDAS